MLITTNIYYIFIFLIPLLLTIMSLVNWSILFLKSHDKKVSNKTNTTPQSRHPSLPDPSSDDFKKKVKKVLSYILMGILTLVFGFLFYEAFIKEDPKLPPDVTATIQSWIDTYYELKEYQQAGHDLSVEQRQSMNFHRRAFTYVMSSDDLFEQLQRFGEIGGDPLAWPDRDNPLIDQIVRDAAQYSFEEE